ncbi:hypothetical protein HK405_011454, partial [Cladochytrium tenue]
MSIHTNPTAAVAASGKKSRTGSGPTANSAAAAATAALYGPGWDPAGDLLPAPVFGDGTPSCLACYQPLETGTITTEFFNSPGAPTRVEEVWPNVFRRLCARCRPQMKMRQGLISQLSPLAITTIVLQCAVRYFEVGQLLKTQPNATTLLNFSYRSPMHTFSTNMIGAAAAAPVQTAVPGGVLTKNGLAKKPHSQHAEGSYEDMIAKALERLNEPEGSRLKSIFDHIEANIPGVPDSFRQSASQALRKGVERGRFVRLSTGMYRLNSDYVRAPVTHTKKSAKAKAAEKKDDTSE